MNQTTIAEAVEARVGVSMPIALQVEITSRCNLKCKMCPLTLGTTLSSGTDGLMEDADWEQVKRFAAQIGRIFVVGFGEPVTHPDFIPMLRELDDLGIEISFSTNGIGGELIARKVAPLRNLKHVNISIDSPDPAIYKEIRGGDLDRALKGMRALATTLPDRVHITVAAVVMKSNIRSLKAFPKILREAGIRFFVLNGLHDYSDDLGGEHIHSGRLLQLFRPKLRMHQALDELREECARQDVFLMVNERTQLEFYKPTDSATEYFENSHSAGKMTKACTVPFDSLYIDSSGKVFPCCHAAGSTPLGDLRQNSIEQVWNGAPFQQFRADLLHADTTPEICRACTVAPWGEHPYRMYHGEVVSLEKLESETPAFRMQVKNLGSETWTKDHPLRLGPSHPPDRKSAHYHPTWHHRTRVATMKEALVETGQTATFEFRIMPAHTGRSEWFQFVVEGKHWLAGTALQFNLPAAPPLRITPEAIEASGAGLSTAVSIRVDANVAWAVQVDADWYVINKRFGGGSTVLELIVTPNDTGKPRSAALHIGDIEIPIRQRAAENNEQTLPLTFWKLMRRLPTAEESARMASKSIRESIGAIVRSPEFIQHELFVYLLHEILTGARPTYPVWLDDRNALRAGNRPRPEISERLWLASRDRIESRASMVQTLYEKGLGRQASGSEIELWTKVPAYEWHVIEAILVAPEMNSEHHAREIGNLLTASILERFPGDSRSPERDQQLFAGEPGLDELLDRFCSLPETGAKLCVPVI